MTSEILDLKLALQVVSSDLSDILGVLNRIEKEIAVEMGMKSPVKQVCNTGLKVNVKYWKDIQPEELEEIIKFAKESKKPKLKNKEK